MTGGTLVCAEGAGPLHQVGARRDDDPFPARADRWLPPTAGQPAERHGDRHDLAEIDQAVAGTVQGGEACDGLVPRAQQIQRQDSGDRASQNLILAVEREDELRNPTLRYTVPSVPLPPLEIKRDALAKSVSQHCSGAVGAHR